MIKKINILDYSFSSEKGQGKIPGVHLINAVYTDYKILEPLPPVMKITLVDKKGDEYITSVPKDRDERIIAVIHMGMTSAKELGASYPDLVHAYSKNILYNKYYVISTHTIMSLLVSEYGDVVDPRQYYVSKASTYDTNVDVKTEVLPYFYPENIRDPHFQCCRSGDDIVFLDHKNNIFYTKSIKNSKKENDPEPYKCLYHLDLEKNENPEGNLLRNGETNMLTLLDDRIYFWNESAGILFCSTRLTQKFAYQVIELENHADDNNKKKQAHTAYLQYGLYAMESFGQYITMITSNNDLIRYKPLINPSTGLQLISDSGFRYKGWQFSKGNILTEIAGSLFFMDREYNLYKYNTSSTGFESLDNQGKVAQTGLTKVTSSGIPDDITYSSFIKHKNKSDDTGITNNTDANKDASMQRYMYLVSLMQKERSLKLIYLGRNSFSLVDQTLCNISDNSLYFSYLYNEKYKITKFKDTPYESDIPPLIRVVSTDGKIIAFNDKQGKDGLYLTQINTSKFEGLTQAIETDTDKLIYNPYVTLGGTYFVSRLIDFELENNSRTFIINALEISYLLTKTFPKNRNYITLYYRIITDNLESTYHSVKDVVNLEEFIKVERIPLFPKMLINTALIPVNTECRQAVVALYIPSDDFNNQITIKAIDIVSQEPNNRQR